jgi:hypothetical protein
MIELTIDQKDIDRVIKKLDAIKPSDRSGVTHKAFVDATAYIEAKLSQNISNKILHVRSGRLRDSISSVVLDEENGITGLIGSGVRQGNRVIYANIQETGGTVTPKRVKWLTIPLQAALTPAGVPRGRARDFQNTFFAYSKAGNLILFQRQGKSIVPLFVLKKSVKVPASHYMSRTADEVHADVVDIMLRRIEKEIKN